MKQRQAGQSLVETSILSAFIAVGALSLLAICRERINWFLDLIIIMIASPIP